MKLFSYEVKQIGFIIIIQYRFNDDGDHDDQLDNCLAAMTTVKESKDRYSAEIERLREEVAHLEVQVEEDEQRLLEIQMTTLDRIQYVKTIFLWEKERSD